MYRLVTEIQNSGPACLIPEVAFQPDGSRFAVTFMGNDEVRVYNSADRSVSRVYSNPDSQLDQPHGVLLTDRHLVVINRHQLDRPATFAVYRLDSDSPDPVSTLATPLQHLREGHSLAMHGNLLVVTHPDNKGVPGALLSYRFDDEAGALSGPLDHRESVFNSLGATKGVAFTRDGRHVLVSFNASKKASQAERIAFKIFKAWNRLDVHGFGELANRLGGHREHGAHAPETYPFALRNGIARFRVDDTGKIAPEPDQVVIRKAFCRLENVAIHGDIVALADTVNHQVSLYDYTLDPGLEQPIARLSEGLCMPHGIKFSPDGRLLVITNYGLRGHNQMIHWGYFTKPRSDKVSVFERLQGVSDEAFSPRGAAS